jgi:hypothetical protein
MAVKYFLKHQKLGGKTRYLQSWSNSNDWGKTIQREWNISLSPYSVLVLRLLIFGIRLPTSLGKFPRTSDSP